MAEEIREVRIEDELKDSYLNYAMSVIISRALPEVRDGLKPSQRRILVAMNDLNLSPTSKYRKCAKICGDTSGNYHPHGESVIYPTLVRMAQDFVMRYPLIEGQGNFGSIDGDPPAAMRYTEARLSKVAMFMLEDLDKNVVNFQPNYDETRNEPVVLPGKFPNLLCNGSSGIAVGMTTEIPPHNLQEVIDATRFLLDKPDANVEELLNIIKGPDFPTGGMVYGYEGLKEAYTKGKGKIIIRGKMDVEETKSGKNQIVITEIPFQVSKADIIERIADLVNEGKIQGIVDIRDESDKEGLRVTLELKKDIDCETVIKQIYKNTQMELNYTINFLVIKDGEPKLLNIKELIEVFIAHRKEVIRRRTQFLLNNLKKELHILEGLLRALANLDTIITLIRESQNQEIAQQKLIDKFDFTIEQAKAILKLPLGKLTHLDRKSLEEEYRNKKEEAGKLQKILDVPAELIKVIKEELSELEKELADKRRTRIVKQELEEVGSLELIVKEDVIITISKNNYIKRINAPFTLRKAIERVQKISQELEENDSLENVFVTNTHSTLGLVSTSGKLYLIKTYTLPELSRQAKGKPLSHIINIKPEDKICKIFEYEPTEKKYLVILTKKGLVKKVNFIEFQNATRAGVYIINLKSDDEVCDVAVAELEGDVFIGTKNGITIRFNADDLRELSRSAGAIRGINLEEGDESIAVSVVSKDMKYLLFVSEKGIGKKTLAIKYKVQGRGGKGIYGFSVSKKVGNLAYCTTLRQDEDIVIFTAKGLLSVINEKDIKETSRHAQGRRILKVPADDRIVKIQTLIKPIIGASE